MATQCRRRLRWRTPGGFHKPKNAPQVAVRPGDHQARGGRCVHETRSAPGGEEPGHVRGRGRQRRSPPTTGSRDWSRTTAQRCLSGRSRSGSGSPCCSPTSPRRWPKGAARRRPTRCAKPRPTRWRGDGWRQWTGEEERVAGTRAAQGRPRRLRSRATSFPATARSSKASPAWTNRRSPAKVAPGHSRKRRRPQRGHGRHESALRPHRDSDHAQSRRDVYRPHDRAGRRRAAAEDAQRDRAVHPAGRPDDRLPAGDRDAAAVRHVQRPLGGQRHAADASRC